MKVLLKCDILIFMLKEDRKLLLENIGISTWEEQDVILDHEARIKLVAGGERAGKSFLGALYVIAHLDEYNEGDILWLVARDYERTRAEFSYLVDMFTKLGFLLKSSKRIDPGEIELVNGIKIKTKSAQDHRSLAMEAPVGIVACEASQIDHEGFLRLRGRIAEKRGWLFLEGTFEGSVGWYPSMWEAWQPYPNNEGAKSFSLPSWTNRLVYPDGRYDEEMIALENLHSDDWFAARMAGKPAPPKGQVHHMFRNEIHVRGDVEYVPGEPVHLWVDPGYSQVTKSAYAVQAIQIIDQQVRVFDEVFEREMTTEDIIEICSTRPWWRDVQHGVIDIAAKNLGETRPFDVWLQKGGVHMMTEKVGIMDGIERFNTFLKPDPINNMPKMLFSPRAKGVLSELGGGPNPFDGQVHVYKWATDREGNVVGRTPRDAFNHGIKAITYGLVHNYGYSRSEAAKRVISIKRW